MLNADHEDWRSLLLGVVDAEISRFGTRYGNSLEMRSWGERNTAAIRHPLSRSLDRFGSWLDMPAEPLSGDDNLPKAMAPDFGASERFAVAPGDEEHGYLHMPTGQSGHPLSPYYRAGHNDWVQGTPSPFLPGDPVNTLILTPAR
jgi:penicillin amidase